MGVVAVAVGGALGALLRYGVGLFFIKRLGEGFPWGTLAVNLVGSFLIGFIALYAVERKWSDPAYLFAVTGCLGGFTTFSAFSGENLYLIQEGRFGQAVVYGFGSVLAGLLLAWGGFALAQKLGG